MWLDAADPELDGDITDVLLDEFIDTLRFHPGIVETGSELASLRADIFGRDLFLA